MHYQIRVMPFELAIVPKVFTTLKAVIGYSLRFYRLHIHIHGRMVNNQVLTSSFIYALNKNTTEPASHLGPFSKLAKVSTDANSKKKTIRVHLSLTRGTVYPSEERYQYLSKEIAQFQERTWVHV